MSKTKELMRDSERLAEVIFYVKRRLSALSRLPSGSLDSFDHHVMNMLRTVLGLAEGRGEHRDPTRATKKPEGGAKQ